MPAIVIILYIPSSFVAVVAYSGPDDWGSVPARGSDGISSLRHCIPIGSGAYQVSYPLGTWGYFPWGKVTGA